MKYLITISALLLSFLACAQPCGTCISSFSSSPNLPIDAGPTSVTVTDQIVIDDTSGTINDLNVYLDISHSFISDINITLTHQESGLSTTLYFGQVSGCAGADMDVTLDDEEADFITCATAAVPAVSGCYQSDPLPGLTEFYGTDIAGTWIITITDQFPATDAGNFNSWCLMPDLSSSGGGGGGTPSSGYCSASGCDIAVSSCDSSCVDDDFNTYISDVNLNNVQNSSGCSFTSPGYSDYTSDPALQVQLLPGIPYTMDVTIFSSNGDPAQDFVAVWIDFNQDSIFDDATEMTTLAFNAANGTHSTNNLLVPPTAIEGLTRMRIRDAYVVFPTIADDPGALSCGSSNYGEVEDYNVYIGILPPNCAENHTPADGSSELCQDAISFSWDAPSDGPTPTGYFFSLGTDNPPTTIYDSLDLGNVTSFTLPDSILLDAAQPYNWRVIPYSADGSAVSCEILSFTTAVNGNPSPDITLNNSAALFVEENCEGTEDSLDITLSGGTGPFNYTWTGNDLSFLNRTDTSKVAFLATSTGSNTYYITVEDNNNCFGIDSIQLDVQPKAEPGTISGNTNVCPGATVNLSLGGNVGNIQWQESTDDMTWQDLAGETNASLSINNPQDGMYYRVKVSNGNCEAFSSSVQISLLTTPAAPNISTSSGSNSFCEGETIDLISDQNSNNIWSTSETSQSITITSGGFYTLKYTDANGCESAEASINIIEESNPPKPVILEADANGEVDFCEGQNATLSIDPSPFDISWLNLAGETGNSVQVSTALQTQVTLTTAAGCTNSSDVVTVKERSRPAKPIINEVDANGEIRFCPGEEVIVSTGATTADISWLNFPGETSASITANQSGITQVTLTNSFGCTSTSDPVNLVQSVNPPKPSISTNTGQTVFCEGENLTLNTTASSNLDIAWLDDNSINSSSITTDTAGSFFVSVFNLDGCKSTSDTLEIEVEAIPEIPEIESNTGGNAICSGNPLTLMYSGDLDRYWNGDPGITTSSIEVTSAGTYFVTVVSPAGCEQASNAFVVTEGDNPPVAILSNNNGSLESSVSDASFEYQWFDENDNPITGENNPNFDNAPDGTFYLVISDPTTGCSSRSANITDIAEADELGISIKIFPNPINRGEEIQVVGEQFDQLELINALGQTVQQSSGNTIETSIVAGGVYLVLGKKANKSFALGKVVVQ